MVFITLANFILGGAFEQEGSAGGGGGTAGTTQSVRGNYKSVKGANLTVEGMYQLISPAWYFLF